MKLKASKPPVWPNDLKTFNPGREYEHTPGYPASRGECAWHLARARAGKKLGMSDRVVLDEIIAGTPSLRRQS